MVLERLVAHRTSRPSHVHRTSFTGRGHLKMNRTLSAIVGLGLTVLLAQASPVTAAEIKIWTARALATVLAEVALNSRARRATSLSSSPVYPPSSRAASMPANHSTS